MKNPHCGKHGLVVRQHGEKKQKTFKDTHTHTHTDKLCSRESRKNLKEEKKGEDEIMLAIKVRRCVEKENQFDERYKISVYYFFRFFISLDTVSTIDDVYFTVHPLYRGKLKFAV